MKSGWIAYDAARLLGVTEGGPYRVSMQSSMKKGWKPYLQTCHYQLK